jgi:Rrf2 family protein
MNISVKAAYALQAIFDLASQRPGEPVKIADIARRQRIPQKFLELILVGLKQAGFLESRRGAEGGYLLVRPPESLSVGEVLRFMEGREPPKAGARQRETGRGGAPVSRRAETPFTPLWHQVDAAVNDILDRTTFADLVHRWTEKQSRYVLNWEI